MSDESNLAEGDFDDEKRERAAIIVVSDFVCPWCYLGLAELDRLEAEYDFDVYFAPFYLHPETPPEGMPARRITASDAPPTMLETRGAALGLKFNRGRTWTSNSHLAFEAAEFASDRGDSRPFRRALFKTYFEDLKNIGDIETLVEVAESAGLNGNELRQALKDGAYRDLVDERIAWSRDIGVTAVPTFVFNERYGIVGAQELPTFRQMMAKIGQPPRN